MKKYPNNNSRIQLFAVIAHPHNKNVRLVRTSDSKPIQCIVKVYLMLASALHITILFSNFNGDCATSIPTIRYGTLYTNYINHLKPTCHVMHQQFNIQQLYALPTLYLCVLYISEKKTATCATYSIN